MKRDAKSLVLKAFKMVFAPFLHIIFSITQYKIHPTYILDLGKKISAHNTFNLMTLKIMGLSFSTDLYILGSYLPGGESGSGPQYFFARYYLFDY
uniref:Uncharacterized protein n=1 Tax=Lepeophtheirus salmonis TaxID=72036 RepID=A0A0K2TLN3_LEPSM